jgi:membrane-associated phospholipid phosphatase
MFDALEKGISLDTVLWLQDHRSGLLELLVKLLNFAGDQFVYIAIIGLIYWLINKRHGLHMFTVLITVSLVTFFLKDLLRSARPYQISPDLIQPLFDEGTTFGFPSGHTSLTLAVWGYLAWWLRRRSVTIGVTVYVIAQALARMIAGVHFPQDVIGGMLVGGLVLALYISLSDSFTKLWSGWSIPVQIAVTVLVSVGLSFAATTVLKSIEIEGYYLTMTGLMLGGGLAVIFEHRYVNFVPPADVKRRVAVYLLGVFITIAILIGLDIAFAAITETGMLAGLLRVMRYAIVGFFALGLWPYICVRTGLMTHIESSESKPEAVASAS